MTVETQRRNTGTASGALRWLAWCDPELLRSAETLAARAAEDQGVLIRDRNAELVAASRRALAVLGTTWDQLAGHTPLDPRWSALSEKGELLSGEEHPAVRVLATGRPVLGFLTWLSMPDTPTEVGDTRWVLLDAHPILDRSGTLIGTVTFCADASDSERARVARKELLLTYRMLAENAADAVLLTEPDSTIRWVAPSAMSALGWTPDKLVGTSALSWLHPDDLGAVQAGLERVGGDSIHLDIRVARREGGYRWTDLNARPVTDAAGAITAVVVCLRNADDEHRMAEAIRASEERYRLLAENAHDVVWTIDLDGNVTYASPAVARMWSVTPAEAATRALSELHPPASRARMEAYLARLKAAIDRGEQPPRFHDELDFRGHDGALGVGEVQVVPQVDAAGRVTQIIGVTRDITARKRAEEELARSQAELAAAQRVAKVGSWTRDLRNRRVAFTEEVYRLAGMERFIGLAPWHDEEVLWEAAAQTFGPVPGQTLRQLSDLAAINGAAREAEFRIVLPDGRETWILARTEAVRDESGAVVATHGTLADVTELKTARDALMRTREELAEAQRVAGVGSWRFDPRTGSCAWSDEAYRLLGLLAPSPGTAEARCPRKRLLELLDPEVAEALQSLEAHTLATGESHELEYDLHFQDGRRKRILARTAAVLGEGRIIGLQGTMADITVAHQEVEARNRRLTRRAEFIARTEHALKTNLAVVEGWAEILGQNWQQLSPERMAEGVAAIQRNASALLERVHGMLTEAAEEVRLVTGQLVPVDVAAVAATVAAEHAGLQEVMSIGAVPASGVFALADSAAVDTIVQHLVDNAIRLTGPEGEVTTTSRIRSDGLVELTVRDTGPGILPGVDLFAAFTKDSTSRGHGLGLHVVQTMVEAMGGEIVARNRSDRPGAEFVITLQPAEPQ